jgi:uncharacterized cupredoxin-like copper-binding protein
MGVKTLMAAAVVVVATMTLAACGDDDNAATSDNGGVTATTEAANSATSAANATAPVTVDVTADDYSFESSITTFKVGVPYHFVVHNVGDEEHEFMIVKPIAAGTMDMEAMDEMAVGHIEEDDLGAGATSAVDVTFDKAYPAGTLELACHIKQHYQKGMVLPIVVEP